MFSNISHAKRDTEKRNQNQPATIAGMLATMNHMYVLALDISFFATLPTFGLSTNRRYRRVRLVAQFFIQWMPNFSSFVQAWYFIWTLSAGQVMTAFIPGTRSTGTRVLILLSILLGRDAPQC
jgi:hypothetical protein